MFKYEEEINARLANWDYKSEWNTWVKQFNDNDDDSIQCIMRTMFGGGMDGLSPNAKTALKKYYRFTERGLIKTGGGFHNSQFNLPTLDMPCAECSYEGSALYFLGMMCINPDNKEYYLVKIGSSQNVNKRIKEYAITNPMIYHDNISLPCNKEELKEKEYNCHRYLASMAYAIAQNSNEWFYVTKENYFLLCEMFKDIIFFQMVANGEVE